MLFLYNLFQKVGKNKSLPNSLDEAIISKSTKDSSLPAKILKTNMSDELRYKNHPPYLIKPNNA